MNDFLYSLRILRRNPGFAVTAVLILALGIGGVTGCFSAIRAVLLKPLEYRDPDRLVYFSVENPKRGLQNSSFSQAQIDELKASVKSLAALGAYGRPESLGLSGVGEPEELKAARVSANFLEVLGIAPAMGRSFLAEEDKTGGPAVAMISARLWNRKFSGDSGIVGRGVTLESRAYTIVGVLPDGFEFPYKDVDVWVTRPAEWSLLAPRYWGVPTLTGFGRLKDGVTLEQAGAEMTVAQHQWDRAHPNAMNADLSSAIRVVKLQDRLVTGVRPMLWTLFGAVGFVLLIACANVAGLLLARATARSKEFAVRAALGAGRARLIGQFLAESITISALSGVFGVLLTVWALRAAGKVELVRVAGSGSIHLDGVVLAFTLAISIATGVFFGLIPAIQASRPDLNEGLRNRAGGATRRRTFGVLVTSQVALSMVLLIGAALLIESFYRLRSVDPGFREEGLLTAKIVLPRARYDTDQKREAFFANVLSRLKGARGIRSAAVATLLPTTAWIRTNIMEVEGKGELDERDPNSYAVVQSVTPDYFRTLGVALERGREFTEWDNTADSPPVMMVNETLARRLWPSGANPIGLHLREAYDKAMGLMEMVGVVADIHEGGLESNAVAEMYLPLAKHPLQIGFVIARTEGDPMFWANAVREQVRAVDQDQPVSDERTMEAVYGAGLGQRRLMMILLGTFAGMALLLAAVGIYGIVAYSVAQRTEEVGVRRALGAQHVDIFRLILGQAFRLAIVGVIVGIGGALALTRVMKNLLFGVPATDSATFAGIAVLLVVVALAAGYLPARKAVRIDPAAALRS